VKKILAAKRYANYAQRKETTEEKYLSISIYRFYIRCTRCSAEITFKTDPKAMDYTCERGAKRNFEVWRDPDKEEYKMETEEEMLDRIEAEQAEAGGAMAELETKVVDAKSEMEIADALDEIRTRNARISRAEGREAEGEALEAAEKVRRDREEEKLRVEREDEKAARRAFGRGIEIDEEEIEDGGSTIRLNRASSGSYSYGELVESGATTTATKGDMAPPPRPAPAAAAPVPVPEFKRVVKKKKDLSAALGIKKKNPLV